MHKQNWLPGPVRLVLVLASILITILGQILLYTTPIDDRVAVPPPMWLSLAGVALFALTLFLKPAPASQKWSAWVARNPGLTWILSGLLLSILAALAAFLFEQNALNNFIPVVSLWLLGLLCYVMAFISAGSFQRDWKTWFSAHRWELLSVGLVFAFGVAVSRWRPSCKIIDGASTAMSRNDDT